MGKPGKQVHDEKIESTRSLLCTFCGGKACRHENWTKQKVSAVRGLHSTWITESIVASQRPSSRLIREYGVVGQFKKLGLKAVFNLQAIGEHPFCGDGIINGAFSYLSEEFMDEGIFFYNFGWTDMSVPKISTALNIAKVISYHVEQQHKILIHCHAGLGRTGLIIACWLVYSKRLGATDASELVRTRRPGSLQTSKQRAFVYEFETILRRAQKLYPLNATEPRQSLSSILSGQKMIFRGEEATKFRFIPKLIDVLCKRISSLMQAGDNYVQELLKYFSRREKKSVSEEQHLTSLKVQLNHGGWAGVASLSIQTATILLMEFLRCLKKSILSPRIVITVIANPENIKCLDSMPKAEFRTLEHLIHFFQEVNTTMNASGRDVFYTHFGAALSQMSLGSIYPKHTRNSASSTESVQNMGLRNNSEGQHSRVMTEPDFCISGPKRRHIHALAKFLKHLTMRWQEMIEIRPPRSTLGFSKSRPTMSRSSLSMSMTSLTQLDLADLPDKNPQRRMSTIESMFMSLDKVRRKTMLKTLSSLSSPVVMSKTNMTSNNNSNSAPDKGKAADNF